MRRAFAGLVVLCCASTLFGQGEPRPQRRVHGPVIYSVEPVVAEAMRRFGEEKKAYERDLAVLDHIREAAEELADAMQKAVALEEAWEHLQEAKRLGPELHRVMPGLLRSIDEVEVARRSPQAADLSRLQLVVRREALAPARRVVFENATKMHDETVQWLKIQETITMHLRDMAGVTQQSLEKSQ